MINLATTSITLHERESSIDSHGHIFKGGGNPTDHGPYPASIERGKTIELDLDGTTVEYTHVAYCHIDAQPYATETATCTDGQGNDYNVVGASVVLDPAPTAGPDLSCVVLALQHVVRTRAR